MGIQNQDTLDVANTTFLSVFDALFANGVPGLFQAFTETIKTSSKINEIDILETMPVVRKWEGEKRYQSIRASKLSATVIKYEKSFEIDRLDLAADKIGAVAKRIQRFLSTDAALYDKIVHDVLFSASGAGPTGYDGVALFATTHPRHNAGTASTSNLTTSALTFAQHEAILVAMTSLRDDEGEPMLIAPNVLMVGPKLAKIASEITQSRERIIPISAAGVEAAASVVAGSTIPNFWGPGCTLYGGGSMNVVVNPRLVGTQDDYYYYLDTLRGPKPIHLFEFRAPEAIVMDRMDGEARFNLDKYRYSVEFDAVATAGAWQTSYAGVL